jgi:transposase InsO family protein
MAWKRVLPMEERIGFVLDVERADRTVSELCRLYEISRKTGYKWIGRFRAGGMEGMRERSRRPLHCPHRTALEWEDRVFHERLKHPRWGPKKIRAVLEDKGFSDPVPAASTIGNILDRGGLVRARRRRRRRRSLPAGPLTEARRPNHVWAVDYKGWFRTADGRRCDPLTVSDLYSRYVIGVRACPNHRYPWARRTFEGLFGQYGLPEIIRCDNGAPFASSGAGGLGSLSVWWILLGIKLELIRPGRPEQNAIHERMHLTLKQEACAPPAVNYRAQQRRFDQWQQEFNQERPHEALGMKRPAQLYRPSPIGYDRRMTNPCYPANYEVRRVRKNGEIKWCGRKRFIAKPLGRLSVGVKRVDQNHSQVWFGSILLGDLYDKDPGGLRPTVYVPQPEV